MVTMVTRGAAGADDPAPVGSRCYGEVAAAAPLQARALTPGETERARAILAPLRQALAAKSAAPDEDNDEALEAEAACKPGCTPADPCLACNCPGWEEMEIAQWMEARNDAHVRKASRYQPRPRTGPHEPSPSGLGALLCPTMGPGR